MNFQIESAFIENEFVTIFSIEPNHANLLWKLYWSIGNRLLIVWIGTNTFGIVSISFTAIDSFGKILYKLQLPYNIHRSSSFLLLPKRIEIVFQSLESNEIHGMYIDFEGTQHISVNQNKTKIQSHINKLLTFIFLYVQRSKRSIFSELLNSPQPSMFSKLKQKLKCTLNIICLN